MILNGFLNKISAIRRHPDIHAAPSRANESPPFLLLGGGEEWGKLNECYVGFAINTDQELKGGDIGPRPVASAGDRSCGP